MGEDRGYRISEEENVDLSTEDDEEPFQSHLVSLGTELGTHIADQHT